MHRAPPTSLRTVRGLCRFLLGIATLHDNVRRADVRAACRLGLTTNESYAVLTGGHAQPTAPSAFGARRTQCTVHH